MISQTLRRRLAWVAMLSVVVGTLVISDWGEPAEPSPAARAERLTGRLRCPVCQGLSVADSNSSTARAISDDVRRRIAAGESDEAILQAYVDRYGEWILLLPRSSGMGALAWALPLATLGLSAGGLVLALRRRRGPRRSESDADRAPEQRDGNRGDDASTRRRESWAASTPAEPGALRTEPPDGRMASRPSAWRRPLSVAGLVAFTLIAAGLLTRSLGERLSDPPASSDVEDDGVALLGRLAGAVSEHPDDPTARLSYARALFDQGKAADALKQFDATARLDPTDAESRAYSGWILFLAGLVDEALARFDGAMTADPGYPDTYALRGTVLLLIGGDEDASVAALEGYLALTPEGRLAPDVRALLAEVAREASG